MKIYFPILHPTLNRLGRLAKSIGNAQEVPLNGLDRKPKAVAPQVTPQPLSATA